MADDLGVARIRIQGDWDLEMISEVSHTYVQVYSAGCFLLGPRFLENRSREELSEKGRYSYPWRGGFSAVNFFRSIYAQLPERYRPEILEISYASPGFFELVGYLSAITLVVRTVTANANRILDVTKKIQEQLTKRKLNKLELRQRNAQTEFVETAYAQLAAAMELPTSATEKLEEVTQRDAWARLKIALAIARRIEKVAQFERAQIASLEQATSATTALAHARSPEKARKLQAQLNLPLPDASRKVLIRHGAARENDDD